MKIMYKKIKDVEVYIGKDINFLWLRNRRNMIYYRDVI